MLSSIKQRYLKMLLWINCSNETKKDNAHSNIIITIFRVERSTMMTTEKLVFGCEDKQNSAL